MKHKIIGLVGEDPNDTDAIANLLKQKFNQNIVFKKLLKNVRGGHLDNVRTKGALEIEYKNAKPNIVLFIRDADGIESEHQQLERCKKWHKGISDKIENHLLLINVYELEALIFADIEIFNSIYKTKIKGNKNVAFIVDPKGKLKDETQKQQRKFHENHCPEIFEKLRIDTVIKNCSYFKDFITQFETLLKTT